MKRAAALGLCVLSLLCGLTGCTTASAYMTPHLYSVPTEPVLQTVYEAPEPTVIMVTQPPLQYGWLEEDGMRRYRADDGSYVTGWLEEEGKRYYFNEYGVLQTGWLEQNGQLYYLLPDGSMAKGKTEIGGQIYYFAGNGTQIYLVNPWNEVPADYMPELVCLSTSISDYGSYIDASCYDALVEMINDCNRYSGAKVHIVSAYRSMAVQTTNYNRKVNYFRSLGYGREDAKAIAATYVAVPGTSEHQLGLAVDIIDTRLWTLSERQENMTGQKWLMENSWRYGFILRYPKDKLDVTGIIYEPWHYRYVGVETAAEVYASGLTLEEYLDSLS